MNVPPSKKPTLTIVTDRADVFEQGRVYLSKLAYAGAVEISSEAPADTQGMVGIVTDGARLYMPMAELVDLDRERERIGKELEKARDNLKRIEGKLANEKFVANAPTAVVDAERERAAKARTLIENLETSLAALG